MENILVTGAAGFIGFHVCQNLISKGYKIVGIDNLNDYYDVELKNKRLEILQKKGFNYPDFWTFLKGDLTDKNFLQDLFNKYRPLVVLNLAAQAGVRYSLKNPTEYINSNILGFSNLLECCKTFKISNLIYASSSSVYGGNTKTPFSENDSVDHPVSLYAATKRANELMAHTYSHLNNLPATGLRFFTVYGPWGRPDMAPMIFTKAIINNKPIKIFNYGKMSRSFTYIDDVVEVITRLLKKPATPDEKFNKFSPNPSTSWCPHRIFNVGNQKSIKLMDFLNCIENTLEKKAIKEFEEMQQGDVIETFSDSSNIISWIGEYHQTPLTVGIKNLINWYKLFYK